MGKQLKYAQHQQKKKKKKYNAARGPICMSLTDDIAGETKVRLLNHQ